MQNANAVLDNLGVYSPVSCGEFEQQGLNGQLDMAFCDAFPLFVQVPCVCQPISPTPPSPVPITTITSNPIPDGNTPIPPSPGLPSCNICGDGMEVTLPDVILDIPGSNPVSCVQLQNAGIHGLIEAGFCPVIQGFTGPCGCQPMSSTPPSPAPITTTTSIPTSDGNTPIPPSPGYPDCNVCGDGMEVTLPDVIIVFVPSESYSCSQLYIFGIGGFISPEECLIIQSFTGPCGCQQISQPGAALSSSGLEVSDETQRFNADDQSATRTTGIDVPAHTRTVRRGSGSHNDRIHLTKTERTIGRVD